MFTPSLQPLSGSAVCFDDFLDRQEKINIQALKSIFYTNSEQLSSEEKTRESFTLSQFAAELCNASSTEREAEHRALLLGDSLTHHYDIELWAMIR